MMRPRLSRSDADRLEAEPVGIRTPADRDEHGIGRAGSSRAPPVAGSSASATPPLLRLASTTLVPRRNSSPCFVSDALQRRAHFHIHAGRDAVEELDHRHLGAEPAPHRAQLEPDIAAADDDQPLRHRGRARARRSRRAIGLLVDLDARQRDAVRAGGDDDRRASAVSACAPSTSIACPAPRISPRP